MASLTNLAVAVLVLLALSKVDGLGYTGQNQGGPANNFRQAREGPGAGYAGNLAGEYGQQQQGGGRSGLGYDAQQYNFRIYTEPEYYGYEAKYPGGRAMYKSYRSVPDYGYAGRSSVAETGNGFGRNAKPYDATSSFRSQRGNDFAPQPVY